MGYPELPMELCWPWPKEGRCYSICLPGEQVMDMAPLNNSQQPALLEGLDRPARKASGSRFEPLGPGCVGKHIPHWRTHLRVELCSGHSAVPSSPRCDSKAKCQLVILGCGSAICVWGGQPGLCSSEGLSLLSLAVLGCPWH